ncbi:unnamed protein product [Urochloa decumbens]|uniref:Uncharacterized protein n=1 Tax=Urochloa decumbens TaxID=240449 RepID=A0ABC9E8W7_9POAL
MALSSNALRAIFLLAVVVCAANAGKPAQRRRTSQAIPPPLQMPPLPTPPFPMPPHQRGPADPPTYPRPEPRATGRRTAPRRDLAQYKTNWIEIEHIDNLVITGKGTLDGQGKQVWDDNKCDKKYDCKILPNSLVLSYVNNGTVSGITLLNSKFFHMNVFQCKDITIKDVTITAPGDSPNTDGIHMGDSSKVTVTGTTISSGDDCISIGPGSTGINITGVTCGPGHGISVGSLGRYKDEKDVTDVNVKDCTLKKTTNGVRIKTYEDAASAVTASDIHYENIAMEDVANPIIIDMNYCPNNICTNKGASKITVKDVTFKNITGTSSTPEAVSLLCNDKLPCSGVTLDNVKVEFKGTNNKTMAVCNNAKASSTGCLKELACL